MEAQTRVLPVLAPKRGLYLDQMAVSNLLKTTLNEHRNKFGHGNPATQFGFWPRLRDQLNRLVHLNLLVCPASSIHEEEAAFDSRLSGLLRASHAQLAANVELRHHEQVKTSQLVLACRAWLAGRQLDQLHMSDVVTGPLDGSF